MTDSCRNTLVEIQGVLDGTYWDTGMLETIARILDKAGYPISELEVE